MALAQGVNSYVTLEEADLYMIDRIDVTPWEVAANEDRAKALVTATSLLDLKYFIGTTTSESQPLAWPRSGVQYADARSNRIITVGDNIIPSGIKKATYELALHLLANEEILTSKEQTFERIKVGPIEIEDSASDFQSVPVIPSLVNDILKPFIKLQPTANTWWRAN